MTITSDRAAADEAVCLDKPRSTSRHPKELLLFGLVGIANTAIGYAVYALCLYLGAPYPVATVLSMLTSVCIGFFGQGRLVFKNADSKRILRYVVMWVVLLLVYNLVVMATTTAGYSAYVGGLVALPFVIPLSFLAQKYYVFRR